MPENGLSGCGNTVCAAPSTEKVIHAADNIRPAKEDLLCRANPSHLLETAPVENVISNLRNKNWKSLRGPRS
jgi:hypothetical protein